MEKLKEYIKENPQSYLGYYTAGLSALDSYFLNGNLPKGEQKKLSASFKKAYELSLREEILKYCFLSVLIASSNSYKSYLEYKKKKNIALENKVDLEYWKEIINFKSTYPETMNKYKFGVVNRIIAYFSKGVPLNSIYDKREYLDNIDYLLLHVLKVEYNISSVENLNLLWESAARGRKSKELINAMFRQGIVKEQLTEKNVSLYGNLIEEFGDEDIFSYIVDNGLINKVHPGNIKLVEKGIKANREGANALGLIEKYAAYCLYSGHINSELLVNMRDSLLKSANEDIVLLLYKVSGGRYKEALEPLTRTLLMKKTHFSAVEKELLSSINNSQLKLRAKHLYKININIALDDPRIHMDVKFGEYMKNESFEYCQGVDNYYFFPEKPVKIRLLRQGAIIECQDKEFDCGQVDLEDKLEDLEKLSEAGDHKETLEAMEGLDAVENSEVQLPSIIQFWSFNGGETQEDRFMLFLCYCSEELWKYFDKEASLKDFINNKILFSTELYLNILKKLQKKGRDLSKDAISEINKEILSLAFTPAALHEVVVNESSLEHITSLISLARTNNIDVQVRTYIHTFSRAVREQFFDINLALLCEEFICRYAVINQEIYLFMENCYRLYQITSIYASKVLEVADLYMKGKSSLCMLKVYKKLSEAYFDYDFCKSFLELYNEAGPGSELVKDCVISMLHCGRYYFDNSYIEIFKRLHELHPKDMVLLQEIVQQSIEKRLEVEQEQLDSLCKFYIQSRILNPRVLKVLTFAAQKACFPELEEYLLEALEYEFITLNREREGYLYYRAENEVDIERTEITLGRLEYPVLVGYHNSFCYSFEEDMKNFTRVKRSSLEDNIALFLKNYNRIYEEDFKSFLGSYCVERRILNEEILSECLVSGKGSFIEAGTFLLQCFLEKDISKAAKYLLKLCEVCSKEEDLYKVRKCLYDLSTMNIKAVLEVLIYAYNEKDKELDSSSFVGKKNPVKVIVQLAAETVQRAIEKEQFELSLLGISAFEEELKESCWRQTTVKYLQCIPEISQTSMPVIRKIFSDRDQEDLGEEVLKILMKKQQEDYCFGAILYEVYKLRKDKELKRKIIDLFLKNSVRCSEEETLFLLKEAGPSIEYKKALAGFIRDCCKNSQIADEIWTLAVGYLEIDVSWVKYVLRNIKAYHEGASKLIHMFEQQNCKILGKYCFIEKDEEGRFWQQFEAFDVIENKPTMVLKLNYNLEALMDDCLKAQQIEEVFKKDGYYIASSCRKLKKVLSVDEVIMICRDIAEESRAIIKENYNIKGLDSEKLLMVGNKPLVLGIFKVEKNNKPKPQKEYSIVKLINSQAEAWLKDENAEDSSIRAFHKLISDSKNKDLAEYINLLEKFQISSENMKAEDMDLKKAMEDLKLLPEERKNEVMEAVIEQDIFSKAVYELMLEHIETPKLPSRIEYLLLYYTETKQNAQKLFKVLNNSKLSKEEIDKKSSELLKSYLRSSLKNRYVDKKSLEDFIGITNLLDIETLEGLRYYLTNLTS